MQNFLFIPKNDNSKLIFRISNKCSTNCNYCTKSEIIEEKTEYIDLNTIIKKIWTMIKVSSDEFNFMLYWWSSFNFPWIELILNYFKENNISKILLHENLDFDSTKINKILELKEKYKFNIEICRTINSNNEIIKLINIINLFIKNEIEININIELDPYKYAKILNFLISKYSYYKINPFTIKILLKKNINFSLILKKWLYIDNKKEEISNILYKKCTLLESYEIKNNKQIIINGELELDDNFNLIFHNNILCYISNINISNINKSKDKIIIDFKKIYNEFVKIKNEKLINKSCYECYIKWINKK